MASRARLLELLAAIRPSECAANAGAGDAGGNPLAKHGVPATALPGCLFVCKGAYAALQPCQPVTSSRVPGPLPLEKATALRYVLLIVPK